MLYLKSNEDGRNKWWHWVLGLIFISILTGLLLGLCVVGIVALDGVQGLGTIENNASPLYFILIFVSFPPVLLAIWVCWKFWHKWTWISMLSAKSNFNWKLFFIALAACFFVIVIWTSIETLLPTELGKIQWVFNAQTYWYYLPFILLLIPIQAATEEILFRGYLNKFLYRFTRRYTVTYVVTSVLFASMHFFNYEAGHSFWLYMLVIFMFGLTCCILTHRFDGLEVAIAYHIAGNVFVISIFSYDVDDMPITYLFQAGEPVIVWLNVMIAFAINATIIFGALRITKR